MALVYDEPALYTPRPSIQDLTGIGGISALGDQRPYEVPDIIEFVCSDRFLNHPQLYPRQATFLKCMFLQTEIMTSFDFDVLEEWTEGFRYPDQDSGDATSLHYEGDWGINPDILYRIQWLKDRGYRWFPVTCAVQGRRSGKGLIGAFAGAYALWHFVCTGSPQMTYGLDKNKRISAYVFAGKKAQARDNQWRDLVNVILSAPRFEKFINTPLRESLTLFAPYDRIRLAELKHDTTLDLASFEIVPKESVPMGARGPATAIQLWDEMANMVATGVSRSAEEVWVAAEPSLGQFKQDAFVYCASSPWMMLGKFYELVRASLEIDTTSHLALDPTILTLQLTSWDIYEGWEKTKGGKMVAAPARQRMIGRHLDGREQPTQIPETHFQELTRAIMEYDAKLQRTERANPEGFRVEYRAKWASAADTYFTAEMVARMFAPWQGIVLEQLDVGNPGVYDYIAHGDPGETMSNFGFGICHVVPDPDGSPIPHVVFDRVHAWTPGDFPVMEEGEELRYEMNYEKIGDHIKFWYDGFLFSDLSFDQWNSLNYVQTLGRYGREISYKPSQVWTRHATAPLNWATAETTKVALSLGRVHLPYHELCEMEFLFLRKLAGDKVDHQSAGPCVSKDVYDGVSICIHKAIGQQIASAFGEQFSALRMGVAMPGLESLQTPPSRTSLSAPVATSITDLFSRERPGNRGSRPTPGQPPSRPRRG